MNRPSRRPCRWSSAVSPRRRALTISSILAPLALSLTGCAGFAPTIPAAGLKIPVDQALRQPCPKAPIPARKADPTSGQPTTSVGAVEGFAVAEDADLQICDGRRAALVATIDAHNALVDQASAKITRITRPWWQLWPQ